MTIADDYCRQVGNRDDSNPARWRARHKQFIARLVEHDEKVGRIARWCRSMGWSAMSIHCVQWGAAIVENHLPVSPMAGNWDGHCMAEYTKAQKEYAEMNGGCLGCSESDSDTRGMCKRTHQECKPWLLGPLFECYGQINDEVKR